MIFSESYSEGYSNENISLTGVGNMVYRQKQGR